MTTSRLTTRGLNEPLDFSLRPEADERHALAKALDILGVKKLSFAGTVSPDGAHDLLLDATLGATVVQPCVVTLEPVTTRIDVPVLRRYLAEMPDTPEADEVEMPEDDTLEQLPDEIDLEALMAEALSLALPEWPRAEGVDPVDVAVTEPGKTPMSDEDTKPFAALKSLKDSLGNTDPEDG